MNTTATPYDTIAHVLANSNRPPEDIEASRRLFRVKARHDARRVMSNYRSIEQFFHNVETALFALCNQDLRIFTVDVAVSLLTRGMSDNQLHKGTDFYSGNKHVALRSRLVQARFFRMYGFPSCLHRWEWK